MTEHPRKVSIGVKLFIIFHIVCITIWAIPEPPPEVSSGKAVVQLDNETIGSTLKTAPAYIHQQILIQSLNLKQQPIKYYLIPTGTWQYWNMFGPIPEKVDFYCDAEVIYQDGSTKTYTYPRMYHLSIPEKFMKERYRKFYEYARQDQFNYLWAPFAQRVAYLCYDDPNNPPQRVKLYRHWLPARELGSPKPEVETYNEYMYFEYVVDQNKLELAKAGKI